MNEKELDRIFRAAGHEPAPEGLREAVMERILAQPAMPEAAPLFSPRQWLLAGSLLVAALAALAALAGGTSPAPANGTWGLVGATVTKAATLLAAQMSWLAPALGAALLFALTERWMPGHRPAGAA